MPTRPPDEVTVGPSGQELPYIQGGVNEELMALIRQLEVPQPKPLTRAQDIGAGLMRIGSALSGGPPNIQSGPEQAYQLASEAATQANQATRRGLIGSEIQRRSEMERERRSGELAALRDEAIAKRQKDAQDAIEKRQKELDEQNARQANHAAALKEYSEMAGDPEFTLPPGEDLGALTQERILQLKSAYFRQKGVQPGMGNALAAMNSLLSRGGQVSSVSANVEGGTITARASEEAKPTLENAPLSEPTARQMGQAGVKAGPGMTELQGQNLLAEGKKAQEVERQKRLGKMTPRGNKVQGEIITLANLQRHAQEAIDMQEASGNELGGVFGGQPGSSAVLYLRDWSRGTTDLSKRVAYERLLSQTIRPEIFGDAGKNLTAIELSIMQKSAPPDLIKYPEAIQVQFLKSMRDEARKGIAARKKMFGLSDEDVDSILYEDYQPSEALPGMVIEPLTSSEAN